MSTPKPPSSSPSLTTQRHSSSPSPPSTPTDPEISSHSNSPTPHSPTDPDIHLDTARLRSTHSTAGYRDGISVSKSQHLQSGFDQGYELGAMFGIRVGWVLGVLEGLSAALRKDGGMAGHEGDLTVGKEREKERDEAKRLLREARQALMVEKMFAREYWNEDGTWGYEVRGGDEGVTFLEVVDQHPLIVEWVGRAREGMRRWGVREGVFEGVEWEAGRVE